MIEEKAIFIIPGFKQLPTDSSYKDLATILRNEGFFPILITIPWKKMTISQSAEFLLQELQKINAKKKYLLGFSFGAMIAFLTSTKTDLSGLILCSLSPYFKEDMSGKNRRRSSMKKHLYRDFSKLHSGTLAKQIKADSILMLYGADEERTLIRRVIKTFEQIVSTKKYLLQITGADHDIGNKRYLQIIRKVAKTLN
ncbi:MAG: hypothetical protein Q8Q49_04940 [bacterium]|nr:hypothetical protein [bacterium]